MSRQQEGTPARPVLPQSRLLWRAVLDEPAEDPAWLAQTLLPLRRPTCAAATRVGMTSTLQETEPRQMPWKRSCGWDLAMQRRANEAVVASEATRPVVGRKVGRWGEEGGGASTSFAIPHAHTRARTETMHTLTFEASLRLWAELAAEWA